MSRGGATNKTAAVRAVLARRGSPMLFGDVQPLVENKLKQIVGGAKLYQLLAEMQTRGEVRTAGRAATRTYVLTAKGLKLHAKAGG